MLFVRSAQPCNTGAVVRLWIQCTGAWRYTTPVTACTCTNATVHNCSTRYAQCNLVICLDAFFLVPRYSPSCCSFLRMRSYVEWYKLVVPFYVFWFWFLWCAVCQKINRCNLVADEFVCNDIRPLLLLSLSPPSQSSLLLMVSEGCAFWSTSLLLSCFLCTILMWSMSFHWSAGVLVERRTFYTSVKNVWHCTDTPVSRRSRYKVYLLSTVVHVVVDVVHHKICEPSELNFALLVVSPLHHRSNQLTANHILSLLLPFSSFQALPFPLSLLMVSGWCAIWLA